MYYKYHDFKSIFEGGDNESGAHGWKRQMAQASQVEEKRWGRREAVIYRLYGQQYIEPAVQGQSWYLNKCEERGTAYSC